MKLEKNSGQEIQLSGVSSPLKLMKYQCEKKY